MRIAGQRSDGCLLVYIDGGMAVLLKENKSSAAMDETVALALGPWEPADNSLAARRAVARRIDSSHIVPVDALLPPAR